MNSLGFARLAVCIPPVRVANPRANADAILRSLRDAAEAKADVALFPELSLSGYTCGDLFLSSTLLDAVGAEFDRLRREAADVFSGVAIVGMPLELPAEGLFNVAALFQNGRALGFVPKTHLPNYREFYELRHFRSGADLHGAWHLDAPVAPGLCFRTPDDPRFGLGVEICEDLWAPQPPSGAMALAGATLLCNLSASNELVGKADYRRSLVLGQSARCMAAYAYAGSGVTESTQDLVFGGHGLVAENGVLLGETKRFVRTGQLLVVDVDLERLTHDRRLINTYHPPGGLAPDSETLDSVRLTDHDFKTLRRSVPAHPFVPADPATLAERCEEVFQIQSAGLAKRIESARIGSLQLGVSGGLDSTLALLVAVRACDLLGMSRTEIRGVTMPGFGTSSRTLANARKLMEHLGVSAAEIDIRAQCLETFRALGHQPFGIDLAGLSVEQLQERLQALPPENREDLVFENVQARIRTLVLMSRGFVVGTGDLSELALGWCTYGVG
ncbi:MAG TPA: NAD(+) synthase, partial [Planctomycetia bacterium]|nr:NAD(+) synthase [Planctomycetia bacterium]